MSLLANIFARTQEQYGVWFGRVVIIILLSFIFFVTGGGISHNEKWRIERVDISGAKAVEEDIVRSLVRQKLEGSYFFLYAHDNSYIYPKKDIERMLLATFPRIKSISVSRTDNHAVMVTVKERAPYALWCNGEQSEKKCWFIDEDGFVFDQAPIFSRGVYVEFYGTLVERNEGEPLRASLPYERFATAKNFVSLLRESIGDSYRVEIKPEEEAEITLRSSAKYPYLADVSIRFKDQVSPEVLLKRLVTAIPTQFPDNISPKKKLLYIDMRFGNKVIFGFEN
ncbi:MAG: hypothetical protein Q7K40_00300 [bacterium]|nr:hypothetical protein [bacterium]